MTDRVPRAAGTARCTASMASQLSSFFESGLGAFSEVGGGVSLGLFGHVSRPRLVWPRIPRQYGQAESMSRCRRIIDECDGSSRPLWGSCPPWPSSSAASYTSRAGLSCACTPRYSAGIHDRVPSYDSPSNPPLLMNTAY